MKKKTEQIHKVLTRKGFHAQIIENLNHIISRKNCL